MEDFHFLYAIKKNFRNLTQKKREFFSFLGIFTHVKPENKKKILNNFAFKFYNKIVNKDVELSKDLILKTLC